MASPTYTLISSNVLSGSAASVTFSSIPSTYTDLVLKVSARTTAAAVLDYIKLRANGNTSAIYSQTILRGIGTVASSTVSSGDSSLALGTVVDGDGATANTFGSAEFYIPSYLASQNKPISSVSTITTNTSANDMRDYTAAGLFRSTTAISSLTVFTDNLFQTGSSFYLYGIYNS